MRVVVPKEKLEQAKACKAYLKSPEWNGEALLYSDWSKTVERLLSTRAGTTYLGFLVARGLVPMTKEELIEARHAARAAGAH